MIKRGILILCSLFVFSCTDDVALPNDETTNDNTQELGHDIWDRVTFTFVEGEVAANGEFSAYENDETLVFKTHQEYGFYLNDDLTVSSYGNPIKLVKDNTYGLLINYYNKDNQLMNQQFTTPEMAPIHQHFFVTSLTSSLVQNEKKVIDYTYRDTSITNSMLGTDGNSLRDENDPIGLKGYFKVFEYPQFNASENKAPEDEFVLRTILVHILGGTKLDQNGQAYLYYQRTKLGNGVTDLDQQIPMYVFTDKNSSNFISDVATEFSISEEQATEEISKRELGSLQL